LAELDEVYLTFKFERDNDMLKKAEETLALGGTRDTDDCILLRTFIEKGWGGYLAWYIPSDDEEATDEQIDVKKH
jgi:hypothetical protein